MNAFYEKKTDDFYYSDDRGGARPLQCMAHLHYHVEIVYMKRGTTRAYIDSEPYTLTDGQMLVVFPNRIHRFVDVEDKPSFDLFIINPDIAEELGSQICAVTTGTPIIADACKNERLLSLVRILADAKSFPQKYKGSLMKAYTLALFGEILSLLPLRQIKQEDSRAMRQLVQYCARNFNRELSLSALERELHLSRYYISHLFSEKLGIRFNDYVNSLRISEACRLLRTSDMSITEVCDASGFGTLRTFNRAFAKQMGVSPSDYKKSNRGGDRQVSIPGRGDGFFCDCFPDMSLPARERSEETEGDGAFRVRNGQVAAKDGETGSPSGKLGQDGTFGQDGTAGQNATVGQNGAAGQDRPTGQGGAADGAGYSGYSYVGAECSADGCALDSISASDGCALDSVSAFDGCALDSINSSDGCALDSINSSDGCALDGFNV